MKSPGFWSSRHIKRVPVAKDGVLVGIVSRANLLHGLANTIIDRHEPSAARDRELRSWLVTSLLRKPELEKIFIINPAVKYIS